MGGEAKLHSDLRIELQEQPGDTRVGIGIVVDEDSRRQCVVTAIEAMGGTVSDVRGPRIIFAEVTLSSLPQLARHSDVISVSPEIENTVPGD